MKKLTISGSLDIDYSEGGLFTLKSSPSQLVVNYQHNKLPAIPFQILKMLNKMSTDPIQLSQNIIVTANRKEVVAIVNNKLRIKSYFAFYSFIIRSIFK